MTAFNKVIKQIEDFIKKYYKNQMIKGGIIFLGTLLLSYLVVSGLEFIGRFGSGMRLFLLLTFIGVNAFLLFKYLLIPILRLTKLGKHLSLMEASDMIGKIFPDIADKLKNTLQLNQDKAEQSVNLELVNASIEQRSQQLSVVPFTSGIDITENKRYLKFFLPVLLIFISVAVFLPNLFKDGTERIVYFSEEFIEPAPFDFNLTSPDEMVQGEDYTLEITLTGEEIPESVKIYTNKGSFILNKKSNVKFIHEFKNVTEDLTFYCEANDFRSEQFEIDLLHKALLEDVSMEILYPKHTGLASETLQNTGDLT
ncbi:MAG: hypothetical protein MK078_17035, partial [Crocinitomicaceae bacterium]|nr:hypothetical protein [Crocinitomicaceae bacterium]